MKKRKNNLIPIFFLVVVLLLMIFSPIRRSIGQFFITIYSKPAAILTEDGRKIKKHFSFIAKISSLKKQNDQMANQLVALQVDKSRIVELEHENDLLKKELGYAEKNLNSRLLSARIIGREPTSFLDYIIVDKGETEGVKQGMAVVSGGVLVGQVKEVFKNQCKVTLITSKDSIVLAMLQNSRSKGILRGGISGLILENITQDVSYEPGEYIVTSGLDGELKPGILIGKTGQMQSASSDLFKNISVEPIADPTRLELVFIVM